MPIHIASPSRREFLGAIAGGIALFSARATRADDASGGDEDLVYILNDTHIGEKHPADSPVPSHLRQVVEELIAAEKKPAAVLINGDLALKDGQPGDYRHLAKLLQPLRDARINLHLTLGNHDHREVFYDVLRAEKPADPPVASRHISVVKTRRANFFLLDSLKKTMVTQGEMGRQQLAWLAAALDALPGAPAIVVAHHNPRLGGDPLHFPGGLIDSPALWKLLASRPHVKAYLHGHIHDRGFAAHQGIHIVNTPATSYVADPKTSTTGWTTLTLGPQNATVTTRTNDSAHAWNNKTHELTWRV